MHPDNGFPSKSRLVNLPMFSRLIGTTPFKLLSIRYRRVTLPSASVSTPYHSLRGASLSQLILSVQFGPSVASYSRTSAFLSVAWDSTLARSHRGRLDCWIMAFPARYLATLDLVRCKAFEKINRGSRDRVSWRAYDRKWAGKTNGNRSVTGIWHSNVTVVVSVDGSG